MKYVISDLNEVNFGNGFHAELASDFKGKVISAGHCDKTEDGYKVYGSSMGYGIGAKPKDAEILNKFSK